MAGTREIDTVVQNVFGRQYRNARPAKFWTNVFTIRNDICEIAKALKCPSALSRTLTDTSSISCPPRHHDIGYGRLRQKAIAHRAFG
jgi:hypothetical protein